MNLCDAKQKAFAQRVYFDLKICRKWAKLHVYFDEINKWIFFLGQSSDDQPPTFVLPVPSDEQLTVEDLFTLKSKLSSAMKFDVAESVPSLPAITSPDIPPSEPLPNPAISTVADEFTNEMEQQVTNADQWTTTATWD